MWKKVILEIIVAILMLFWVYAGLTKLLDYDTYWRQVGNIVGNDALAKFLAIVLPLTQLVIAASLFWNRRIALIASLGMISFFTGYIVCVLYFAPVTPCSCTGIITGLNWQQHLVFNTAILLLNSIAILINKIRYTAFQQATA